MAELHGTCDERYTPLAEVLARALDDGSDLGASLAVTVEGEPVVDVWGGWADVERTTPWTADTITNVWSTTKTMTALAALVLVDRGELDLHEPVSTYWPEFAANGKEHVEVRHLLSHTSGVPAWEAPVTVTDIYDWEASTARLAAQAPWWEPGTASGYHAVNQGHLVGEVVRRITGMRLGEFFRNEIAGPLGADFHIGLPPEHDHRVSNVVPPPPLEIPPELVDPTSVAFRALTGPAMDAAVSWTTEWRRADLGAVNGHGNARSVARVQSIVSNGGEVGGVRLLTPATIDRIFDVQSHGVDLVLGIPIRFGVGYGLPEATSFPMLPDGRIGFWGGWGGSVVVVDVDRRTTMAYMMNKMATGIVGNATSFALMHALYSTVHHAI